MNVREVCFTAGAGRLRFCIFHGSLTPLLSPLTLLLLRWLKASGA